mmetsp:Transcript_12893/g.37834  ORF Transcript_12893/g.37834 Transcript_12893/m.37834 type:complete len:238 (+) Transcript_12893:681-1394(+)
MTSRFHFATREVIRRTWAKGNSNVYFVIGSRCDIPPSQRMEYTCDRKRPESNSSTSEIAEWESFTEKEDALLEEEQSVHHDLVFVPVVDVYRALPQKLKESYEWGTKHTDAEWFVKIDDDMFIDVGELETYLSGKEFDSDTPTVVGKIAFSYGVLRTGKWTELIYEDDKYPPFPLGSKGHSVSRPIAEFVTENMDSLFNYQGEDTSLGIWLDESHLKKEVQWIASTHFISNHQNCNN